MEQSSNSGTPRRGWRALRLLLLLIVVVVLTLATEHWRGRWALQRWKQQWTAKGEIFKRSDLWPAPTDKSVEFSNRIFRASINYPGELRHYSGMLTPIVSSEQSGYWRRGSQEPTPLRTSKTNNSWQDLDKRLQERQSLLQTLRELMKDPPSTVSFDIRKLQDDASLPNFVQVRQCAQALQTAVMNDLHNGNLASAGENLQALLSFEKLYEKDPTLINFMIRIAVIGLTVDVGWDALQADGWTEPQLAALQQECLGISRLLSQMPRTLESERAGRIDQMEWFRSHSYQSWVARELKVYQAFGEELPAGTTGLIGNWRQWLFHPAWSFAWADQEELVYLRHVQRELAAVRASLQDQSWVRLKKQLTSIQKDYRAPAVAWRFYSRLPLSEELFQSSSGGAKVSLPAYPYSDFSRAWQVAMNNLTLHEMMVTAIALKRYELIHHKPAANLKALIPDLLPALPRDLIDGETLRYRLKADGSFVLYSVGDDGRDDGGDIRPVDNRTESASPWRARDSVWPQLAAKSAKESK